MNTIRTLLPGIAFAAVVAVPAWLLGKLFPIVGGPVFGIILGIMLAALKRPTVFDTGIKFTGKKVLQAAIILLGFEMNLFNVLAVGSQSLIIMIFTLAAAFITAWFMGSYLKLVGNTSILIAVGTAICGGSAIAATAPVISANDKEIAYAISTVFLFNIAAVFIFPFIGHLLDMSDIGFGIWAGTAINDTSSVVAAAYSYSPAAGEFATIVKLTRTLMIIPITLVLAVYTSRASQEPNKFNLVKIFPWFVLGFLATTIISTTGIIPAAICDLLGATGKFFIIMAMAAIGLNTHVVQLLSNGIRPILLGLSCWIAVAVVSLVIQYQFNLI
ncbi:MAG: YeiH family putative sulfate export transporter [Veillonellaceae bacterium]|jgi:uncharacterized integral membrane protein (TIGR00698 family)|nr:YeiH family putative sulfate export transporter [Veillonellaceae bacterium]